MAYDYGYELHSEESDRHRRACEQMDIDLQRWQEEQEYQKWCDRQIGKDYDRYLHDLYCAAMFCEEMKLVPCAEDA